MDGLITKMCQNSLFICDCFFGGAYFYTEVKSGER